MTLANYTADNGRTIRQQIIDRNRLLQRFERVRIVLAFEHAEFVLSSRITERESDQKAIELRFRQRKRTLILNRVLGREHDERLWQRVRHPVDRHLRFFHCFQQC